MPPIAAPAPPRTYARLPELGELEALVQSLEGTARTHVLATATHEGEPYPIHGLVLGPDDRELPTLAMIGGIHGLERIGTQVVLAYLTMLARLLEWDRLLHESLAHMRLVFVPLVNPVGMAARTRANGHGVDLMRNAPVHPHGSGSFFVGGQSLSPRLPWFRGFPGAAMEPESHALCEFVRREVLPARSAILIDVHSGYGVVDRLWFPYARTRRPFPALAEVYALTTILDRTLPNHVYRVEPQAQAYTIQGDLWDHMFDEHRRMNPGGVFVPLTLEMGSWLWLKKNPRQIFDALGTFNPMEPHRLRRTLRRHLSLFDLLRRAAAAPTAWSGFDDPTRTTLEERAFDRWYTR